MTVKFVFDYRFDTNGFFTDPAHRTALEHAGKMLGERLADTLDPIVPSGSNTWSAALTHPGTGATQRVNNPRIAADTLVIYAGGRSFSGSTLAEGGSGGWSANGSDAWFDAIDARGEPGALTAIKTDFATWGGSITFDTVGTPWHFGLTTAGLSSGETDFVSVAMHELGHVLGIHSGNDSWGRLISAGKFTGPATMAANGGVAPPASSSHFADGVKSDQLEVMMDPSITNGTRKLMSQLDAAALKDIGWTLNSTADDTIYTAQHHLTQLGQAGTNSAIVRSTIGTAKDVDIYRIYAAAGSDLSASAMKRGAGTTKLNTFVRLFDVSGRQLAIANQGGVGATDTLNYRFVRSDYYFVSVTSFENRTFNPLVLASGRGGPTGLYQLNLRTSNGVVASLAASSSRVAANPAPITSTAPDSASVFLAMPQQQSQPAVLPLANRSAAPATNPPKVPAIDLLLASFAADDEEWI